MSLFNMESLGKELTAPLSNFDDNAGGGITGSTGGIASFQIKSNFGAFQISSESKYGDIVFIGNIDPSLSALTSGLALQYVSYRITDLEVSIRNVAPFSSASGSVQVAYVNDPNNMLVSDPSAVEAVIRQSNSRQVGAKDTLDMRLDSKQLNVRGAPSDWKFCRPHGDFVFNRYGSVVAVVRAVPAIGDGSQFVVSINAKFEFHGMTNNSSPYSVPVFFHDPALNPGAGGYARYSDEFGSTVLTLETELAQAPHFTEGVWHKAFAAPLPTFKIVVSENVSPNRVINFETQVRSLDVKYLEGKMFYRFIARDSRLHNLQRPLDVSVVPCDQIFFLVYSVVESEQLIGESSITPGVCRDLQLLRSITNYVDDRIDASVHGLRTGAGSLRNDSS